MAIAILDNQMLGFNPETNCVCGSDYCQPMALTDEIKLFGTITPTTGQNIMLNGPFNTVQLGPSVNDYWDLDTDWSIGTNKLIGADPAAGSSATYLPALGLKANHIYAITVVVNLTGSELLGNGVLITVNGDNLIFPDMVNVGKYLADGSGANYDFSFTWLYIPNLITTDNIIISRRNDTGLLVIEVTSLIIREVSTPAIAVYDLEGNQQYLDNNPEELVIKIDGGDTGLEFVTFVNPAVPSGNFFSNNRYFNEIDLADLKWMFFFDEVYAEDFGYTGCGTLRVFDRFASENLIYNGAFTDNLLGWTAGDGWTWSGGKAHFDTQFPPVDIGTLTQTVNVAEWGGVYIFSFILSNLGGIGHEAKISYDIGNGYIVLQDDIGTNGTYNFEIDTDNFTGTSITFKFERGSSISSFDIDTVTFTRDGVDNFQESNCINIQESQDCTLLFTGVNTDLAFAIDVTVLGYTYDDTGIVKSIRLYAKKKYASYPEEKEIFKFSNNLRRIMYAESDKEYQVDIGDAAEHAHDLLRLLRINDTFTIDGVQYSPNGDYELRTRKRSDNSQAVFMVVKTQGISSNYSCQ